MYEGCGVDTLKWCIYFPEDPASSLTPLHDRPGLVNMHWWFGSPHPLRCHFSFCDGSVRTIGYDIDPQIHSLLGDRHDGQAVDAEQF
jgi:prepilin-type processing-associated H-X9-DG protein